MSPYKTGLGLKFWESATIIWTKEPKINPTWILTCGLQLMTSYTAVKGYTPLSHLALKPPQRADTVSIATLGKFLSICGLVQLKLCDLYYVLKAPTEQGLYFSLFADRKIIYKGHTNIRYKFWEHAWAGSYFWIFTPRSHLLSIYTG